MDMGFRVRRQMLHLLGKRTRRTRIPAVLLSVVDQSVSGADRKLIRSKSDKENKQLRGNSVCLGWS